MRSLPVLLLTLAACGGDREQPWYAEIAFATALNLEYDADGLLHVLYSDADGMSWPRSTRAKRTAAR